MHQSLFFENIEQAVCLITKAKADFESINGVHIDFNATFH